MTRPVHTHFIRASLFGELLLGVILAIGLFMSFAPEIFELMR